VESELKSYHFAFLYTTQVKNCGCCLQALKFNHVVPVPAYVNSLMSSIYVSLCKLYGEHLLLPLT